MKKLISLMLILCMTCMLIPAMADGAAGVWYGDYFGTVMMLTLGEDGTSSLAVSGNEMAAGTWAEKDGKIEITMKDASGEESTQTATLADGVLTLADGSMSVEFTQTPIEAWTPGEVKTDAAAEEFEGEWKADKAGIAGLTVDASAAGMGDFGVKIENGAISFSGSSADSITFFIGTDPIQMTFENGALNFSRDIPNDAEPITFVMKAEMLQDGMMALTIALGSEPIALYLTKAAE